MARPLRIEFEGAWYHVMNRGADRRAIFRADDQRGWFLDLLGDAFDRFGVETHAYCLMDNHYHLLLHTPQAKLSRAMRHIDGVYTQRVNRAEGADGPLFRGRFRSILVDADSYLLAVSRYIHRNPLESGTVSRLDRYRWSSYPAYIGRGQPPVWLHRDVVLGALGQRRNADAYRDFVENSPDPDTDAFYGKARPGAILGDEAFRERALTQFAGDANETPDTRRSRELPQAGDIVTAVARTTGIGPDEIMVSTKGRAGQAAREARMLSMYLCQQVGRMKLTEIRDFFGLGHYGSVAGAIARYREKRGERRDLRAAEASVRRELMQEKT